ncbi:MAG: FtsQ-type POTRA domain-containing protein [Terracidiphilus sp.]
MWEDEAPAEPRLRRVRPIAPATGRSLPGMPLEMNDSGDEDAEQNGGSRSGRLHRGAQRNPWWRPASTAGRVSLSLAALIVLSGCATSAIFLKKFLERDERFRIHQASDIQADGLTQVSRAEMLPVFGEDIGRNVFHVPLAERRKQLEQIPWVERATVMRLLPGQIRVAVVERQPVAFVRQGAQICLVDANGVLLTMPAAMMAQHHYSFPVVTGIDAGETPASRKAKMAIYQRLLAELDSSGQKLSEQISEIDLSDSEDAKVLMPEQGGDILAHFGQEQFLQRYQRFKEHIDEWRQQYPKLVSVDLRYDQQAVLQMDSGASAGQAAASAQNANGDAQSAPAGNAEDSNHVDHPAVVQTAAALPTAPRSQRAVKVNPRQANLRTAHHASAKSRAAKARKVKSKNKKHTPAKRAAFNPGRSKTHPTIHPAASSGEGQ